MHMYESLGEAVHVCMSVSTLVDMFLFAAFVMLLLGSPQCA